MRLVQDNSYETVAHHIAMAALNKPLRELAANLMQVSRGAGRPESIIYQMGRAVAAIDAAYTKSHGYPVEQIRAALLFERPENADTSTSGITVDGENWQSALNTMTRGALQIAASTIMDEPTQLVLGERELLEGLQIIEKIREANCTRDPAPPESQTPK